MKHAITRLAVLAALGGCSGSPPVEDITGSTAPAAPSPPEAPASPPPAEPPAATAEAPASLTSGDLEVIAQGEDFGYRLFGRLRASPGNLVFSPASVRIALAMTYAGARGETAAQMARTLAIPEGDTAAVHRAYGTALRVWNATESATLRVANRVYTEQSIAIEAPFLALTRDVYGAEARPVDFVRAFEPARIEINGWVAERTERRIEDLLPPGALDTLTRLVLANAVYFKGTWQTQFAPERTEPMTFTLTDGGTPSVNMMQTKARFAYARHADGLRVLELPYSGDELRMVFLLPERTDGLPALEGQLDAASLRRWRASTREVEVEVGIPRFRMEPPTVRLGPTLAAMGMPLAFSRGADLSGMARLDAGLFVSEVYHKAFVEVNEEGTEAAAATAVVVKLRSIGGARPETPRFYADHPFLFLLVDQRTGSVLFLGRVADPR